MGKRRPCLGDPRRPGWVWAARGGARPHSPAPVASLSPRGQHSASSSQSAQRADVPMVPGWMVPPHNKLPAFRKGGRRWGQGERRGEEEEKEKGERERGSRGHPLSYNLHNLHPTCQPTHLPTHPPPRAAAAVQAEPVDRK